MQTTVSIFRKRESTREVRCVEFYFLGNDKIVGSVKY